MMDSALKDTMEDEWSDEELYTAIPLNLDTGNLNDDKPYQPLIKSEAEEQNPKIEYEIEHQQHEDEQHSEKNQSDYESQSKVHHQDNETESKEHQPDNRTQSKENHYDNEKQPKERQINNETQPQDQQSDTETQPKEQQLDNQKQAKEQSDNDTQSNRNQSDNETQPQEHHSDTETQPKEHQLNNQKQPSEHQSDNDTHSNKTQPNEHQFDNINQPKADQSDKESQLKEQQSHLKEQQSLQESSDDDVPLIEVQKKIQGQKRKRKQNVEAVDLATCFSDSDYSDLDKNYVPSSDNSSYSDDYQTPVSGKRKRKWMRKRIRPLIREQGRKEAMEKARKLTSSSATSNVAERHDSELQEVLNKSKKDSQLNKLLKRFAETRLTNLLSSNGLERKLIKPDGNCFFNSIIHQINTDMSTNELRSKLCRHLEENEKHYIGYITKTNAKDELQLSEHYSKLVEELGTDGIWNTEMSDVLPLAAANMLAKSITIYSSRLHSPIIHVTPDMGVENQGCAQDIKMAYLIVPGLEHYDSCIQTNKKKQQSTPCKNVQTDDESYATKTPTKRPNSRSNKCATPRKKADYVSPKKVKQSRKKTPNIREWKKNIRKTKRNTGKAYISDKSKNIIEAKKVLAAICNNCKNRCTEKVSEESRQNIFRSYYDETMTFERKRDFICQHVEVLATSKRYGRKRKQETRKYYLPVEKQRKQVCKSFFLNTLNIGKKTIECSLKRKSHGSFDGIDRRGRHTPANKTDAHTIRHIKNHIESFPAVESHYTRKLTSRKFLSQYLSIRKMYDLYKTKCADDGMKPVSEKVYRDVFLQGL